MPSNSAGTTYRSLQLRSMRHPSPSSEEVFTSPQLTNPRTQDVFQSIVKGRKSWKTLRGGEVVWPPELEAALIEGLENYEPDDSRETRLLGRFPLRNRFISDWIFEKTGKRRSAKQVGSRLQQLRDTCGGRKLLNLLSPRRPIPKRNSASRLSPEASQHSGPSDGSGFHQDSESGSDRSSPGAPTTPTEIHATLQTLLYRGIASSPESPPNSVVYIDLLPSSSSSASKAFVDSSIVSAREEELMWSERGMNVVKIYPEPRYISEIDPSVTFTSPTPIAAVSVFSVYLDDDLVYSEDSPLKPSSLLGPTQSEYLYNTQLLPGYWAKLCQMSDLSRHTIIHRVVDECQSPSSGPSPSSTMLFSTMYRFKYCQPSLSILVPTFNTVHDLSVAAPHKDSTLDLTFDDSILSISSGDSYYDKPQGFYDLSPWNNGTSVPTYQGSH